MHPRLLILSGAALSLLGIAAALLADPAPGGLAVLVGVGTCAMGLHRLGRSGSDRAVAPDAADARGR